MAVMFPMCIPRALHYMAVVFSWGLCTWFCCGHGVSMYMLNRILDFRFYEFVAMVLPFEFSVGFWALSSMNLWPWCFHGFVTLDCVNIALLHDICENVKFGGRHFFKDLQCFSGSWGPGDIISSI